MESNKFSIHISIQKYYEIMDQLIGFNQQQTDDYKNASVIEVNVFGKNQRLEMMNYDYIRHQDEKILQEDKEFRTRKDYIKNYVKTTSTENIVKKFVTHLEKGENLSEISEILKQKELPLDKYLAIIPELITIFNTEWNKYNTNPEELKGIKKQDYIESLIDYITSELLKIK